jgi:hypothetical protein
MRKHPAVLSWLAIVLPVICAAAQAQDGPQTPGRVAAPEEYSPLGFYDLRLFEQSFPETPGHPLFRQAAATKYWAFRGVAYRNGVQPFGSVWATVGPETTVIGSENVSGRVAALAISAQCQLRSPCRLWVGTAGGGVWRTDDAMNTTDPGWRWISQGLGTNSIGSLALDPGDRGGNTIYVGTGETNSPHNSGAGTGLYKSTDGGDHWVRVSTTILDPAVSPTAIDFTSTRGIASIAIEPGNSRVIYVATSTAMLGMTGVRGGQSQVTGYPQPRVGLYKTENGGATWSLIWVPPLDPIMPINPHLGVGAGDTMIGVRHVKLDPRNPRIVYATAWNNAIHRSAPSLENGDASFKPVFAIVGLERFRDLAMFDLTVRGGRTRMYVYNGTEEVAPQGLYRLDNADVRASTLVTTGANGTLSNTPAWVRLSSDEAGHPGLTSRRICSSQCFYDLVVAVPPNDPDTVYVGGVATPSFGDPTIRSTHGGTSFTSFGNDSQDPRNSSHVDVRAIAFHPRNRNIVFVGSDGGVVRNDGTFVDISDRCGGGANVLCPLVLSSVPERLYFMNKGLQTLQFYNVALDPRDPLRRMLGGLQDNGTIWLDGTQDTRTWRALFPAGDGTSASGFHPTRSEVLFASFQSNRFFTNFRNGDLARWARTDDPMRASSERATITASTGRQFITFDQVSPDTQFTGFQHIWRTQNNGGDQAFLEANCVTNVPNRTCGDWIPLGVDYPFAPNTNPSSPNRQPGDLTSTFYGLDRAGGIIVSAERTPADRGTLWAATSFGRLFVSKNADAAGRAVQFTRIDNAVTPNRFVTRIVVDRTNPNAALVSYSGFNALTASTPGHVFRVVFDPVSGQASVASLDFDLGDLPINTLAYDDVRGDIYAGTDFGPLMLRLGSNTWEPAGVGFPEVLMVDLEIVPEKRLLVAATHGLGIFYMTLR